MSWLLIAMSGIPPWRTWMAFPPGELGWRAKRASLCASIVGMCRMTRKNDRGSGLAG